MGDKAGQIAQHIDQQRAELRENVFELRQKAIRAFDWRSQVDARPVTMIGIAFGGGVLLSMLMNGRPHPRSTNAESATTATSERHGNGFAGPWNQVKGALWALAATKLTHSLNTLVPGFQEEFQKAKAGGRHQV
jgi:hypothetical protein